MSPSDRHRSSRHARVRSSCVRCRHHRGQLVGGGRERAVGAGERSVQPTDANQAANWLPAPKDGFTLMMRLYWPEEKKPSILDGSWKPPAVAPASETPRVGRPPPRR